jgi:hypothetical protein
MKNDLFKGATEMIPAIQKILEVDTPDKNNMFNKNSGSDELRYLRFMPSYLDSLVPFVLYRRYAEYSEDM